MAKVAEEEIQVEEKLSWVVKLEENYESYDPSEYGSKLVKKSIYKWPNDLVAAPGMFRYCTPHMVSFGPYHHGEKHLQLMEHHKERALHRILQRSRIPLSSFVNSLKDLEQVLWDSYDNLDSKLSSNSFLRMMLLDGCFMLELLHTADPNQGSNSEPYDPVFNMKGKLMWKQLLLLQLIVLLMSRNAFNVLAVVLLDIDAARVLSIYNAMDVGT